MRGIEKVRHVTRDCLTEFCDGSRGKGGVENREQKMDEHDDHAKIPAVEKDGKKFRFWRERGQHQQEGETERRGADQSLAAWSKQKKDQGTAESRKNREPFHRAPIKRVFQFGTKEQNRGNI